MDRMDLCVEVPRIQFEQLTKKADGQTSEYIDGVDNTFNTIEWK